MTVDSVLDRVLTGFHRYYDINTETPIDPFDVEATFETHDTQYLLMKSAKVSEQHSKELVYFKKVGRLTSDLYGELEHAAWEDGLSRAELIPNHRNTDVTLVIIADELDPGCDDIVQSAKLHKSYMYGLRGYSVYRLVVCDLANERVLSNRRGSDLGKTVSKILTKKN